MAMQFVVNGKSHVYKEKKSNLIMKVSNQNYEI